MHQIETTIVDGQIIISVGEMNIADGTKVNVTIQPATDDLEELDARLTAAIEAGIESLANDGGVNGEEVYQRLMRRI